MGDPARNEMEAQPAQSAAPVIIMRTSITASDCTCPTSSSSFMIRLMAFLGNKMAPSRDSSGFVTPEAAAVAVAGAAAAAATGAAVGPATTFEMAAPAAGATTAAAPTDAGTSAFGVGSCASAGDSAGMGVAFSLLGSGPAFSPAGPVPSFASMVFDCLDVLKQMSRDQAGRTSRVRTE